jgi:hypothetical protein
MFFLPPMSLQSLIWAAQSHSPSPAVVLSPLNATTLIRSSEARGTIAVKTLSKFPIEILAIPGPSGRGITGLRQSGRTSVIQPYEAPSVTARRPTNEADRSSA